ncbi:MAG: hypothetical protein K8S97_01285, partial [Anaerolineae bacterium]|nr:hypothetical protein [Anaerolineae bacterium]
MATTTVKQSTAASRFLSQDARRIIGLTSRYILFTFIGLVFMLPFVLAFLGGFKTDREIFDFPPRILPDGWTEDGRFAGDEALSTFSLLDITSNELHAIPESELRMRTQDGAAPPFTITGEARTGWSVRDQYGLSNWINVFKAGECRDGWLGNYCFLYWLWNSVFLAAINVLTRVFLAAIAGYAFARLEFPG